MKACREIEALLYLYEELTSAEKTLVDRHLLNCESCCKLFESVQSNQKLINRAAQVSVVPQHAGRLTSNIMEAIHVQTPKKQSGVAQWIKSVWTKYMLAGTSLLLVMMFIVEQQPTPSSVNSPEVAIAQSKTVTLNSTALLEEVRTHRESKKHTISLYDCAKTKECENEIIKNFRLKKSS